jgi:hypothetical protein
MLERPIHELRVAFSHALFRHVIQTPPGQLRAGTQRGAEIPVGQMGYIDVREGPVVVRERVHRVDPERPENLEPAITQISQGIAGSRIFPIDDGGEHARCPEDISRPIVTV